MNDILRVGVVISEKYSPETGGGFGYYDKLIRGIDNFNFDSSLEFSFLRIGNDLDIKLRKPFLKFNPKTISTKEKKKLQSKAKLFSRVPVLKRRLGTIYAGINKIDVELTEAFFIENKIDLLYYVDHTGGGDYNFPFVTSQWDIGHLSMYCFPEVSMNGTFESREDTYNTKIKKALAIFCESEAGKNELSFYKQINPQRIFVVPLFAGKVVDITVDASKQLQQLKKFNLSSFKYFLYPAQFWSHKNHYNLLQAFAKVHAIEPELKLVLTGSDKGNLKYIKEVTEELKLTASVIFSGFIGDETLYSFYKNATAMVMPSFLGPTNMPLVEAAFLDCPVIASDFNGHREMLGNYANYINPTDVKGMSEIMLKCYYNRNECKGDFENNIFNLEHSLKKIEENLIVIKGIRKTWGFNFQQF